MKIFTLERHTTIPASINDVWNFFSCSRNLAQIMPGYMKFTIRKYENKGIYEGMILEYRVRPLLNIPLKWLKEITEVKRFT